MRFSEEKSRRTENRLLVAREKRIEPRKESSRPDSVTDLLPAVFMAARPACRFSSNAFS